MTKITSRTEQTAEEALIDKISDFLEMRIAFEFDELKDDIQTVKGVNDALMEENMRFRDQITKLTIDNMKLASAGPIISVANGTLYTTLTAEEIALVKQF